ncbi:MAG: amidohydrolase family protein [Nocardioides sp.]
MLGKERAGWQYPFGALHRAGADLAAGSDWPVSSPDPLAAIHVGVTRTAYGEPGRAGSEPFLPEQALDLASALSAYTAGSARLCHRDDAGVLAPGRSPTWSFLTGTPSQAGRSTSAPPGCARPGWQGRGCSKPDRVGPSGADPTRPG